MAIGRWTSLLCYAALTFAPEATAQTAPEAACRDALAKGVAQYSTAAFRDTISCYSQRASGRIPADSECNQPLLIVGGKSGSTYEKASSAILAACTPDLVGVLAQYGRCPTPYSTLDDDGPTSGIDDFQELADCVLNVATTTIQGVTSYAIGETKGVALSRAAKKCQATIGKVVQRHILTIMKVRRKCQAAADQAGDGVRYSCAAYDDGKIAADLGKLEDAIDASCALSQDELETIKSCGQTAEQLKRCLADRIASPVGGGLVAAAYELPNTCKIGHVSLLLNAGHGVQHRATNFDIGYNGRGLDVDLIDGFEGAVDLDCGPDCTGCAVTIAPVKDEPKSFCRCDSDPTLHCDTISGPDLDDCGGGQCTCTFGPPLPLQAAGVPACVVNRLEQELDGVADAGTGVSNTTITNRAMVHLGISQTQPCPVCENDPAANDGVRGGTCLGGTRSGLTCDRNGYSPDFGPLSYECPPSPGSNISGAGLRVTFALTSIAAPEITTALTDHGNPVFCLQCSEDTSIGCQSDAECAAFGAGTCTANTGPPAHANGCNDGICTPLPGEDSGYCAGNASDMFCDGIVRASGHGLLGCNSQGDCDAYGPICPGGNCGGCSLIEERRCLPDPLTAIGTHGADGPIEVSGVFGTELVSTFCVAATPNAGINSSTGLPGPGRMYLDMEFDRRCASDHSVQFEPPGGSNCP